MTKKAEKPEVTEVDHTPTREEARAMFAERKDLASVLTDEGILYRGDVE